MIEYRKALLSDIEAMQSLVADEVKSGIILERTSDEMATNIRSYTLALKRDRVVGFVALHIHSLALAEIRSLVVDEAYRAQNIGSLLVTEATAEGKRLGLERLLALTYAEKFFLKLGFVEICKESLPEQKIWADCIRCKHFPICNEIALIKTL